MLLHFSREILDMGDTGRPSFFVACQGRPRQMLNYRRRLPHWIPDDAVLFVTWRLAGPPPARPEILTAGNTGRTAFGRHDRLLDGSSTSPLWLRDTRVARMVENALQHGEAVRRLYSLYACVMPNHVHLVFAPNATLPSIMRWLKGRTARAAKPHSRTYRNALLSG